MNKEENGEVRQSLLKQLLGARQAKKGLPQDVVGVRPPERRRLPHDVVKVPEVKGLPQNAAQVPGVNGLPQNAAKVPRANGLPQNAAKVPRANGLPQNAVKMPGANGLPQKAAKVLEANGLPQKAAKIPGANGLPQNIVSADMAERRLPEALRAAIEAEQHAAQQFPRVQELRQIERSVPYQARGTARQHTPKVRATGQQRAQDARTRTPNTWTARQHTPDPLAARRQRTSKALATGHQRTPETQAARHGRVQAVRTAAKQRVQEINRVLEARFAPNAGIARAAEPHTLSVFTSAQRPPREMFTRAERPAREVFTSAEVTPRIVVDTLVDLKNAVTSAPAGVLTVIEVGQSFSVNTVMTLPVDSIITVTSSGGTQTLTRAAGFLNSLFSASNRSTLTLNNIVLDGNRGSVTATGQLITGQPNSNIVIEEGTVLQNSKSNDGTGGGAIKVLNGGSVMMTGGLITNNSADSGMGGGICSYGPVLMTGGEISGNTAYAGGGVGIPSNAIFTMDGGLIDGNSATANGGGVSCYGTGALNMNGGTIAHNLANNNGGGIYTQWATVTLNAGLIEDNTGYYGGGIYLYNSALANLIIHEGVEILGNHAAITNHATNNPFGGGIFVDIQAAVTQDGGLIAGNDSTFLGGGVYSAGDYQAVDSVIANNVAANYGGGFVNGESGYLSISSSTVTGNSAGQGGGGLYLFITSSTLVQDSLLTYNVADKGGGAYVANSATLILDGADMLVADNSATSADNCNTGGGIFSNPRTNTTVNPEVIFTRNYATHAYNMPLETDLTAYNSVIHDPSLDPQYEYAWNNADINYCPLSAPTMQITYHRNSDPSDPLTMIFGSNLTEGADMPMIPPPWDDSVGGELNFAGWSLIRSDTCPHLTQPMPTTYHAADFSTDNPKNLNVYAIWCPEAIYHEVTFDANGGTPVPSQSVLDGDLATFATTTRAGCIFDGWYTNKQLDVRFNFNTPLYEDLTLHAKWICPGTPEYAALYASLTPEQLAELAELEALLAALEAGEKCYNIGILTEYGYQLVEHNGTLYLHNQLTTQPYLAIVPITIAEVVQEIDQLEKGM